MLTKKCLPLVLITALLSLPTLAAPKDHKQSWQERYEQASPELKAKMVERKAKLAAMTPEQKEERKAKLAARKSKWDAMTPEQKEAHKARITDRKAKWDALTPEQQEKRMLRRKEKEDARTLQG